MKESECKFNCEIHWDKTDISKFLSYIIVGQLGKQFLIVIKLIIVKLHFNV